MLTLILMVFVASAHPTELFVVPHPRNLALDSRDLKLSSTLSCKVNRELLPLINLLGQEYHSIAGGQILSRHSETSIDLTLAIDRAFAKDAYRLVVGSKIEITGGSYQAVAMGSVTFLQMITRQSDGVFAIPQVTISDSPELPFRGLLVDVARNWHDVSTLKHLIELARWYKVNYLQLHLTDNELFTFPSRALPALPTPDKHYTKKQLLDLVEYARVRGVAIIPEIDVPGHSRTTVERMPTTFGFDPVLKDTRGRTVGMINIGREAAYVALGKLIKEVAKVFHTSSYIHIGGDEPDLEPVASDPQIRNFISAHCLGDINELYRYFIVRMGEIVQRNGKQMIVWEGFQKDGKVQIPRDVIVAEFETAYQLPQDLLAGGYKAINASWQPLYVVNDRKWNPDYIYNWNPYRWESPFSFRPSFNPIQLEPTSQILGAMMCAWEQPQEIELQSLRQRVAAMSERVWDGGLQPERSVEWFDTALTHTDAKLDLLLRKE
jgi:hexosaminidase